MPTWITGAVGPLIAAVGSVFNYLTGRSAANNQPDVVNNDVAKKDADDDDQTNTDVINADSNSTRNDL